MGHGISRVGAVRHIIEAGRNCDQLHCGLYRERSIRGWSICLDGRLGLSCAQLGPIGQIAQQTARPTERRLRSVQCTANPAQFNPFVDSAAELCDNSARNAGHQPCDQAFPHPRGWGGGKLDICTLLVRGCPIIYRVLGQNPTGQKPIGQYPSGQNPRRTKTQGDKIQWGQKPRGTISK